MRLYIENSKGTNRYKVYNAFIKKLKCLDFFSF